MSDGVVYRTIVPTSSLSSSPECLSQVELRQTKGDHHTISSLSILSISFPFFSSQSKRPHHFLSRTSLDYSSDAHTHTHTHTHTNFALIFHFMQRPTPREAIPASLAWSQGARTVPTYIAKGFSLVIWTPHLIPPFTSRSTSRRGLSIPIISKPVPHMDLLQYFVSAGKGGGVLFLLPLKITAVEIFPGRHNRSCIARRCLLNLGIEIFILRYLFQKDPWSCYY